MQNTDYMDAQAFSQETKIKCAACDDDTQSSYIVGEEILCDACFRARTNPLNFDEDSTGYDWDAECAMWDDNCAEYEARMGDE